MSKKALLFIVIVAVIVCLALIVSRFLVEPKESAVYRIGVLQMTSSLDPAYHGFKAGMEKEGFIEGENVTYDYKDAAGDVNKLAQHAEYFVDEKVDLIYAITSPSANAAKNVTEGTEIPVIFTFVADPLSAGFIETIKSSGNNLTGVSCDYINFDPKRLELFKEAFPDIKKVLMYYRPEDKSGGPAAKKVKETAPRLGLELTQIPVNEKEEIISHLESLKEGNYDAIFMPADSMVTATTAKHVEIQNKFKIPVIALHKTEVEAGCILGYGVDAFRIGGQPAPIAAKVLGGEKPSSIPIQPPDKFLLVVDLKAINELGLKISENVLDKADVIIQE